MKKFVSFILLSMVTILILSCAGQKNEPVNTDAGAISESDTETALYEAPQFPNKNYDGYEFKILCDTNYNAKYNLVPETISGEPVNDAAYERNSKISDQFGITFNYLEADSYSALKKSILSDNREFNLVVCHPIMNVVNMIEENLLFNVNDMPYVNLKKPWWNQSIAESFAIKDKLYFVTGDYSMTYQGFVVFLFSKDFITDYAYDDPYKLVFDGAWTVDALNAMAKPVSTDINGDGVFNDQDQYGLTIFGQYAHLFMFAMDQKLTVRNADGIPELAVNTPRMIAIVEKYYDLVKNGNTTFISTEGGILKMFKDKRALFTLMDIGCGYGNMRDIPFDFGLIPYPKLNESQENYRAGFAGGIFGVPFNCEDPERTSIILEALNYESYKILRPAFFDIVLYNKCLQDEASVKILTLLHESKVCDFAYNFDKTGLALNILSTVVETKNSTDFTSYYASVEDRINDGLNKIIETVLSR